MTVTKLPLSNSTNGRSILVSSTGSAIPTPIHIAPSGSIDEVYLYAYNDGVTPLSCSVLWGATTEPTDVFRQTIQPKSGRTIIADGRLLTGNLSMSAYAESANAITIDGFANRIGPYIPVSGDNTVSNWVQKIVDDSGSAPSANTQEVLNTFVSGLYTAGLMHKMIVVNCMVPDSLTASLIPLIRNSGYGKWINNGFVSSDLTINGLKGDGVGKYLNTGILPATTYDNTLVNLGITLYCSINNALSASTVYDLATVSGGTNQVGLLLGYNQMAYFDNTSTTKNAGRVNELNPYFRGYINGNYSGSTFDGTIRQTLYTANPVLGHRLITSGSGASTGTPVNTYPLFMFQGNSVGTPAVSGWSPRAYSFVAIHLPLTQAESATFYSLITTMRTGLGGGYVNADPVADWASRVVANGGAAPSAGTQTALTTFYNGLVSNNLLCKMKVINPIVPDNITAVLTPFWNVTGSLNLWTNVGFVSGDLTVNGLKGNGSSYMDTGFYPAASYPTSSDAGITVYVSGSNTATECEFGGGTGPSSWYALYTKYLGTTYFDSYDQTNGRISGANTFFGYFSANRGVDLSGGIRAAVYTASSANGHGIFVSNSIAGGGTLPMVSMHAMANNGAGQASNKRISFLAVHSGLTPAESSTLYTLVQTLRTSLGGGYV